jgi:XTP/dITP diphosphohydrolase
MSTILIATRNAHKVAEIRSALGGGVTCRTVGDFPDAPEVVEDAGSFSGNATKKALVLARWLSANFPGRTGESDEFQNKLKSASELYVLADDSGVEVDALNGAPGIHSARFASLDTGHSGNSTDSANRAKLLRLLKEVPFGKRTARFRCVLALTPVIPSTPVNTSPVCCAEESELQTELFEGTCEGRIAFEPRGHFGFGYDPLFIPDGFDQSFAELGDEIKNQMSHRGRAIAKLKKRLFWGEFI